ncbi:MAG: 50S ribosomal protein L25 [Acidimicrobiia bacterium]
MSDVTLAAEKRTSAGSGPAGRLRRQGRLPAVVYGLETDCVSVTVPTRELNSILHSETGANTLITLKLDGDSVLTLARQIQRHPVRGDLLHVDFIRIRRDTAVQAEVPITLTGEPEGVKNGGLLEQLIFTLTVEAKPADIPTAIEADVSQLDLSDQLHISDLVLPRGVVTLQEPTELVAQVAVPRGLGAEEEGAEGEAAEGEGAEGGAAAEGGEGEASGGE